MALVGRWLSASLILLCDKLPDKPSLTYESIVLTSLAYIYILKALINLHSVKINIAHSLWCKNRSVSWFWDTEVNEIFWCPHIISSLNFNLEFKWRFKIKTAERLWTDITRKPVLFFFSLYLGNMHWDYWTLSVWSWEILAGKRI